MTEAIAGGVDDISRLDRSGEVIDEETWAKLATERICLLEAHLQVM